MGFPWVLTALVSFNGICNMYQSIWTLLCDWTLRQIFCPFVFQGTSVLSPGLHIGLLITLAIMIYKKSTTRLFEKHSCLYVLTFGFVNAKISQKLVVRNLVSVLNLLKINWLLAWGVLDHRALCKLSHSALPLFYQSHYDPDTELDLGCYRGIMYDTDTNTYLLSNVLVRTSSFV